MSQASAPAEAAAPAAKKKPNIILIAGLALLLLGGGGGGYWFFIMRPKTAEAKEAKEGKEGKGKKKAEKGASGDESASEENGEEASNEESASEEGKKPGPGKGLALELPDDKEVKKIIDLPPFIVNLADKGESYYLRLSVSVGVGESKEEKADPLFTTRVRNAILTVLTTKSSEDVLTQEGKSKLRKELLKAARAASKEPRVEAIYITDLIVQL